MKRLAVLIVPKILGAIAAIDEYVGRIPILRSPRQVIASGLEAASQNLIVWSELVDPRHRPSEEKATQVTG